MIESESEIDQSSIAAQHAVAGEDHPAKNIGNFRPIKIVDRNIATLVIGSLGSLVIDLKTYYSQYHPPETILNDLNFILLFQNRAGPMIRNTISYLLLSSRALSQSVEVQVRHSRAQDDNCRWIDSMELVGDNDELCDPERARQKMAEFLESIEVQQSSEIEPEEVDQVPETEPSGACSLVDGKVPMNGSILILLGLIGWRLRR